MRAFLLASVFFVSLLSTAQEIDFQNSIDATSKALSELDLKANDCLLALDSSAQNKQSCDDFIAALNGELMANYLKECRSLKSWRDNFVTQRQKQSQRERERVAENTSTNNQHDEEMLRRLVAIEFNCGENTLQLRTQSVVPAFSQLQSTEQSSGVTISTLTRQLSDTRFNAIENRERQRLQNAVQSQQSRNKLETERQFNALQNELIRQQIQKQIQ